MHTDPQFPYRFLPFGSRGTGAEPGRILFIPIAENRHQQEVFATRLEDVGSGRFKFTRKMGTTLVFESTSVTRYAWTKSQVNEPPSSGSVHTWARLVRAEDRFGTVITYSYAGQTDAEVLAPARIACRGRELFIEYEAGLVSRIRDPRGAAKEYSYAGSGEEALAALSSVTDALGHAVRYDYDFASERDQTPAAQNEYVATYFHCDLGRITDQNGASTVFSYAFDRSRQAYMYRTDIPFIGWYTPAGNPRNVSGVQTPATTASFNNPTTMRLTMEVAVGLQPQPSGPRIMKVTDAEGGNWTYVFSDGEAIDLYDFENPEVDASNRTLRLSILFKRMNVMTPAGEDMEATFEKSAGMALSSFRDVGQTVPTRFEYADRIDFEQLQPWMKALGSLLAKYPTQFWGDPTKQIDAEGGVKTFDYDAKWRVMRRIVDEEGHRTDYTINPANGNRLDERVRAADGRLLRSTSFAYSQATGLGGVMVRRSVDRGTGTADLVTHYELESGTGNVLSEQTGYLKTTFSYDLNNNKKSSTDARGHTTRFEYDALNRIVEIHSPGAGSRRFDYDRAGNKVREDDENGNTILREFDGLRRLTAEARDMNSNGEIDAPDLVTRNEYDGLGMKKSVIAPNGHTSRMEYDALKRLVVSTDAAGYSTRYSYGANSGGLQFAEGFRPTRVTDPRGYLTSTVYDRLFRPIQREVSYGPTPTDVAKTTLRYDRVGNLVAETDPLGRTTTFTYDALARKTASTLPDGTTTQTSYTASGLVWRTIDELGAETSTEYDGAGKPVRVTGPAVEDESGALRQPVTTYTYDGAGNQQTMTNPRGHVWTYSYDERNRKVQEVRPGPDGATLQWAYDEVGNVVRTTDARGHSTETTYDAANRPVRVVQPSVPVSGLGFARPTTVKAYDKNGNVVTLIDANGNPTTNTYDALNRLVSTTDAEGITVTNSYDAAGNRISVTDGNGQTTLFAYDGLNRNTSITDPLGQRTAFEFDPINKTARIDALGRRTLYSYDARNRMVAVTYPGTSGNDRSLTYDAKGNLLSVTEPVPGRNVAYTYDALGRVVTETSNGATHRYYYDLAGNRLRTMYGGSSVALASVYDEQNRLTVLTQGPYVTRYSYDRDGNVLTKQLPNGDVVSTEYDALGRRTVVLGEHPGAGLTLYRYGYEHDAQGNVRKQVELSPQLAAPGGSQERIKKFAYDRISRLVAESDSVSGATTYAYDAAHNRIEKTQGTLRTVYSYNAVNQLLSLAEGPRLVTYAYDANGNRLTRSEGNMTDTFRWDVENRLVGLTKQSLSGGGNYLWDYDYRTRRVGYTRPGMGRPSRENLNLANIGRIRVIFSGGTSVREIQDGTVAVDYVRGSDWGGGVGGILYTLRNGLPSFTHYNGRGDVVAKTNGNGSLTYQASYEGFGLRQAEWGSTPDRQKSNTKDEDIPGYANEGHRFRDVETGTFLSKDPLGFVDGPNLYAYVQQNPWTKFDPEGLNSMYVAFPKQPIFVPDKRFGLDRLVTGADRNGYSTSLGHAGVVLIDPKTGKSNYYEFGRYDPKQEGEVRKDSNVPDLKLPDAKLGNDGKPTKESLEGILKSLSETTGKGTKAEGVFFEGSKETYEKQKEFAEKAYQENGDADRKKYSGLNWNCGDFARETVNQGLPDGKKLPDTDARPAENVKEIQKRGQPVGYVPKANSTSDPKPQPPPKREEDQ